MTRPWRGWGVGTMWQKEVREGPSREYKDQGATSVASRVPLSILPKFASLTQSSRGQEGQGWGLLVLAPHPPTPTVVPREHGSETSGDWLLPLHFKGLADKNGGRASAPGRDVGLDGWGGRTTGKGCQAGELWGEGVRKSPGCVQEARAAQLEPNKAGLGCPGLESPINGQGPPSASGRGIGASRETIVN